MERNRYKESKNFIYNPLIWITSIILLVINPFCGTIVLGILLGIIVFVELYFHGKKFACIKSEINVYIEDCNSLNKHIEELRSSYIKVKKTDYGEASFNNISRYNYKKVGLHAKYAPNIYDCSRQVCGNAQKQPFKYICKYFNIQTDEETLSIYEEILNNFSAAEEGKLLLVNKKNAILENIKNDIPMLVRTLFTKKLEKKLGFEKIAFNELFFPKFIFRYISPGGNAGTQFTTIMDIPMLERFEGYINENIKRRKSAVGQRALMTPKLRNYIKQRDNYICKRCGNSLYKEPNLLLEIDHIIPIAKGGLTEEKNLQTLCWKCNRTKGANIYN